MIKRLPLLLGAVALAAAVACFGQAAGAGPAGTVDLTVRLPNPGQQVFFVREVMPVRPGPLTLYYPKYIPGDHSPDGPIGALMGLEITAGGQRIAWHRDTVDMFTFHLTVPEGVESLAISFQYPGPDRVTPRLMGLEWNTVALYQAGYPTKLEMYRPTLVIPSGWRYATALTTDHRTGDSIAFRTVPFDTLVDSPVIAGEYFREVDLTPAGSAAHCYLDMVGDTAAAVDISAAQIAGYRRLIEQAQALFHSHHYDNYHLLLTLSDYVSKGGLEHHQSSDDRARGGAKMFADAAHFMLDASLLPHEYTHSWNGKFMRPAELWQPNFESPEQTQMLWVYEGLTVYLGDTLTARSGLWTPETWREAVAYRAASMAQRTGRAWRPLSDTTVAAQLGYSAPNAWSNWSRGNDFYREGQLLWLAVDMKIRTLSQDQKSLDDFARLFFGVDNGSFATHTFTFNDIVNALNAVQPYDWAGFLHNWLDGVGPQVPLLSGIDASGWRLVYTGQPSRYQQALENVGPGELSASGVNAMFSVGLFLDRQGEVEDVLWDGPAFKAGLAPGMKLVAINGQPYSTSLLRSQIAQAQTSKMPSGTPLQIRAQSDGVTALHTVVYAGGPQYPHLVRVPGTTDYLRQILAPVDAQGAVTINPDAIPGEAAGASVALRDARPVTARHAMVVSAQHLATQAGVDILKQGGNAVDAAVAVAYALAVVHPCCGNIGGGGFMTIHLSGGNNRFLNFREKAPLRATPNMFLDAKGNVVSGRSVDSYLGVGVPGTVMGLDTALKTYGTMTRQQVMARAIELARRGYVLEPGDTAILDAHAGKFAQYPNVASIFLNHGKPYAAGQRLVQRQLAHTLELIAQGGAKAFYEGPIAQAVVKASDAHGGILSMQDFADYTVQWDKPLTCGYHGYTIVSAPPPSSGGATLCEILQIVQPYPLAQWGFGSVKTVHYLAEAERRAFADRNTYLGDPAFVHNPVAELLSPAHAAQLRASILPDRATPSSEIKGSLGAAEGSHTTHFSVVDKDGNAVAVTFTINFLFGNQQIAGNTGFFLNDEMDDFTSKPGVANAAGLVQGTINEVEPGKRPLSSMTPTIVLRGGKLFMVTGSPGDASIISTTLESILNVVDFGMNMQQAVDAPRLHQQWYPQEVYVEQGLLTPEAQHTLEAMGYKFELYSSGADEAILVNPKTGVLEGANDPHRPAGLAAGY